MDKKSKADIQKHYRDEYMRDVLDKKPGRVAKMARALLGPGPMSRRMKIGLSVLGTAQGGVIAGSVVVGAVVIGGLIPALIAIPVGIAAVNILMAPVNIPLGISLLKAKGIADKAIDKDIENGTLVTRYQAEVLDKPATTKPAGKIHSFFNRKSKKNSPDSSTSTPAKTPVLKRHFRIKQ